MKLFISLVITVCILFILYPAWFRPILRWVERIFLDEGGKHRW